MYPASACVCFLATRGALQLSWSEENAAGQKCRLAEGQRVRWKKPHVFRRKADMYDDGRGQSAETRDSRSWGAFCLPAGVTWGCQRERQGGVAKQGRGLVIYFLFLN